MVDDSENKTTRVQLLMAPSEVETIDDWGFKNRIRTRAEAIRRLCQIGLLFDSKADDISGEAIFAVNILGAFLAESHDEDDTERRSKQVAYLLENYHRLNESLFLPLIELKQTMDAMNKRTNTGETIVLAKEAAKDSKTLVKEWRREVDRQNSKLDK